MAYDRRILLEEMDRLFFDNPNLRLKQLSEALGAERHTIEAILREERSLSFTDYRQEKLLNKALLLMSEAPALSVKQIAVTLGYHPDSFSRFIRKHTAKSPSELRRELDRHTY